LRKAVLLETKNVLCLFAFRPKSEVSDENEKGRSESSAEEFIEAHEMAMQCVMESDG